MSASSDGVAIPPLHAPEGARQLGGGSNSSPDEISLSTRLTASLGLSDVAEHYPAQLLAAGWRTMGELASVPGALAARLFEADGRDGAVWVGTLSILRLCPTDYKLQLRLVRRERNR